MSARKKVEITKEEVDRRFREMLGDDADDSANARKRRRILRAAYELFLAHGYRKTSIDDVARKAEVAKGTVYLYFANKGQLLIHAVALEKATMRAQIAPFFDGTIPKHERLGHWIEMALKASRDLPLVSRLLAGDSELVAALEDAGHEEMTTRTEEGVDFVATLVADVAPHLDEAEQRRRAEALIAISMTSTRLIESMLPGRSLEQLARTLADMMVHGVGGPPKER